MVNEYYVLWPNILYQLKTTAFVVTSVDVFVKFSNNSETYWDFILSLMCWFYNPHIYLTNASLMKILVSEHWSVGVNRET